MRTHLPFRIVAQDGVLARGSLVSNEIESDDCYLLLSLAARKLFGVVKYQRRGCCFLEESGRWIKLCRTKKNHLHYIRISESFARMDDRQIEVDPLKRNGIRQGRLVSKPDSIPGIVRYHSEEPLPDADADNGRVGADTPQHDPIMRGTALDPVPGQSISTGEMRPYYTSASSQGKHVLDSVPEPGEWRAQDQPKRNIEINADDHLEGRLRHPGRGPGSAMQRAKILANFRRQNVKRARMTTPEAVRNSKESGLRCIAKDTPREDPSSWLSASKGDGSKRRGFNVTVEEACFRFFRTAS